MLSAMIREAYQSLAARPLRSALTMVGFAIGVGAFVAMVSFASGARRSVVAQFEALGRGTLVVTAGGHATAGERSALKLFEAANARAVVHALPGLRAAPMGRLQAEVSLGSRRVFT
ncbi:MAG TPA: ABC transporter permease, partial [Polyangia bacterium]